MCIPIQDSKEDGKMREARPRPLRKTRIQLGREPKVFSRRQQPIAGAFDRTLMDAS
jgi:hypothetical protein